MTPPNSDNRSRKVSWSVLGGSLATHSHSSGSVTVTVLCVSWLCTGVSGSLGLGDTGPAASVSFTRCFCARVSLLLTSVMASGCEAGVMAASSVSMSRVSTPWSRVTMCSLQITIRWLHVVSCHAHDGDVDITTGWQPLNTQGQGQQDTHSLVTIAGSYRAARAQSTDQSWSFTPGSPPASRAQDTAWCRLACVHRARGARSIQRPWEISQSTDCSIKTSFTVSPWLKAM